jgi:hypothetical protein
MLVTMTHGTAGPESKRALLEAFGEVLRTQAEERDAERRVVEARRLACPRVRPVTWLAVVMLLLTAAYFQVERPAWIVPPPPPPESGAVREASLRIALANAAQHIERYRRQTGRLPLTLGEAGAHGDGISYEVSGPATYQLHSAKGPLQLSLRSTDSLPTFLGNSFEVILRRSR